MIFKSAFVWLMILFILLAFLVSQTRAGRVIPPAHPARAGAPASVNPKHALGVMTKTTIVDAGRIQTGDFFVIAVFTIGGDSVKVAMFLEASDLYKDGNPVGQGKVGPIALNTGKPAEIIGEFGQKSVVWRGAGNPIGGFPSKKAATLTYGIGQRGREDISCKIWYTQPVATKPAGQYSGVVRLTAMVVQ